MDGKKKLEELVAGLDGVTPGPWQVFGGTISDFDREWPGSLSMEFMPNGTGDDGVNERHEKDSAHIARCDPDTIRSISDAYKAMEAENERLRTAVEFTAKMCWRTDPPNAVNTISDGERLSAIKFHPTIKKYGEPHEQLRVAESEARHEG